MIKTVEERLDAVEVQNLAIMEQLVLISHVLEVPQSHYLKKLLDDNHKRLRAATASDPLEPYRTTLRQRENTHGQH